MRLLQSVLPGLRQTTPPQRKFLAHLFGLLRMLPGHATCRNLRRYSAYDERTFSRWYARDVDCVSLTKAAIRHVTPVEPEHALVSEASVVPKSGQQTSGLDRCWNGRHGRSEQGLDISALAWRDITANCAYSLRVEQTPPTREVTAPEATRIAVSLAQWTRGVSAHDLRHLHSVITDGDDSKQTCLRGVHAFGRHQMGTRRSDAHLRALSHGPKRLGPGRPKRYDGTVHWDDLARFAPLKAENEHRVLSHQVRHQVQCQCTLRVVRVVDTTHNRRAVLFSTDVGVDALTISRYDTARFHIECLCRDAKQWTGLGDCQARSHAKLACHFKASVTAATLAKLEARQPHGDAMGSFAMASLKRRAFPQHLIDRICHH